MKRDFLLFFFIALTAEIGTTWLQKFQGAKDLASGLYYPDLGTMMLNRLIIWLVLFFLLSALGLLLTRAYRKP